LNFSRQAFKLFRRILLASAAIPVMFPPIYLEVEATGNKYDEVHVDGGAVAEVITYELKTLNLILGI
jgi:predicted acylesterase/phospholipase RssA